MKKDETAEAIALRREEGKPGKVSKEDRIANEGKASRIGVAQSSPGYQKAVGAAPSTSTKRAKTFGS